jgi:glycosyltransferase involved in cell wall biosynthesis
MKILFPFVGDSVGGSHKSAIILIQSLMSNGVDVHIVLHIDNGPLSDYLKFHELQYDVLPTRYLAGTSPSLLKIAYGIFVNFYKFFFYVRKNNITIVHANDLRINLTWSVPVKATLSKFVWHQRTLLSSSYFWRVIPYLSNYLIAISEIVYSTVPSSIPVSKKRLIYNPIHVDPLYNKTDASNYVRKKYNISDDCILLGYVGRLNEEWKRVDFLISCFSSILNNNYHLLIVGECNSEYCEKLKKIVSSLGIEHRVSFTGFITDPMFIISSLDILIAPSRNEPFGRTLLESMSQKTVVLASDSGGHREIVSDDNGFLFKLDDCRDLEKKIKYIQNNHQLVEDMAEKAYLYVIDQFSPLSHMEKVLDLYNSLQD